MTSSSFHAYYKIGRFILALALLIAFHMTGLLAAVPRLSYILIVYCFIALIRFLASENSIGYLDFIFDIVFISALVHVSFAVYSYMTLFYLFPVFFSSIIIGTRKIFLYPVIAICFYAAIFLINGALFRDESLLSLSLHAFSFFTIAFAGHSLKERTEKQGQYIDQLEEERIRMQGYERLYRVSADLAHELRNPLAAISASVQFLKEGKHSEDFIEMLDTETKRLTNLVNDFLMFSRPSDAPREDMDLSGLLKIIIAHHNANKKISSQISEGISVNANPVFMEVALTNIVKNASEAAESSVFVKLLRASNRNIIEIEDDGPGIDEAVKDRIFEPFFTTKQSGTGLGLAIAYRVITSYGGYIIADKSPHGGAKMTVVLPAEDK